MTDKYIGKFLDNRYEILQVIGTGGMAVVYKALCHRLKRHVAIKILKDEYAKDEEFRNRFRAESHAVAMLSHPNIVAVYDVSRSTSIEYIVMELVDGMTLKQYMERRGTLSQKESVHFATQILKALSHAHSKGIIHRDIKPHNIMLLRDSTVKVTDFGIARFESSQKTVTREAFGSVHYIAPEQAKGSHIDCRADIYSTGVVLYEMLTGRLPYEGDTPVSVAIQHINSLPLSPREINSEIPEALEKITMKAMSASLEKRYGSTDEMLADLDEFRKNPHVNINYEAPIKNAEDDESKTKRVVLEMDSDIDDEEEYEEKSKSKLPLISAISALAFFIVCGVILLGTLFGWWKESPKEQVLTPDIIGLSIEEAQEKYSDFEIIEADANARKYSDAEEGDIIEQRPKSDEVNASGKIYVTLSKGQQADSYVVPTGLTNKMTESQAKQQLSFLDEDQIKCEYEYSEEVSEGDVIRTSPGEGATLNVDDVVTLYISLGKVIKDTEVPEIAGLSEAEAVKALEKAKLGSDTITREHSDKVEEGIVIRQLVDAYEMIPEGSDVGFVVSLGAEPKQEPEPEPEPQPEKSSADKPDDEGDKPSDGDADAGNEGETESETDNPASEPGEGLVELTASIALPSEPESFVVRIDVNDKTQYEELHSGTDGSVEVTLTGQGDSNVRVYIDGKLFQEVPYNFK